MADRKFKLGASLVCSYISRGQNGKMSLIDVYGGDIVVGEFPARLAIAIYGEFFPDPKTPQVLEVRFSHDGNLQATAGLMMDEYRPGGVAIIVVDGIAAFFDKPGLFTVELAAEGYEPAILARKNILLGNVTGASASPQPS